MEAKLPEVDLAEKVAVVVPVAESVHDVRIYNRSVIHPSIQKVQSPVD